MRPRISIYSTAWNLRSTKSFDIEGALANWAYYADNISIAVPQCDPDNSHEVIEAVAKQHGYPVSIVRPDFTFDDPFFYGKTENAALQNCNGGLMVQQNLDERLAGNKDTLLDLGEHLIRTVFLDTYYVPVVNLYGSLDTYLDIAGKWYVHKRGFFRGPVKHGIKADGRPDYNLTSTDELINGEGQLVPGRYPLLQAGPEGPTIEAVREYVKLGMPYVLHLGYLSLADRLDRSLWWKSFWINATGGDKNQHPTSIEEMAAKASKPHGLSQPLWPTLS